MPNYDYLCSRGHLREVFAGRDDSSLPCEDCGEQSRRVITTAPHITGCAVPPMNQRKLPLDRFINAQQELVRDAEKAGVEAPDILGAAKRQARRIQKHAPELVGGT